jgi:NACalpha-BTF3-like transcription factor
MFNDYFGRDLMKELSITSPKDSTNLIKHINVIEENCLICNSNNKNLFGVIHKYNKDTNKFFYCLNDTYHPYNIEHNYKNFSEGDIQLVMKETKCSRKHAILKLKDKDLSTILIENYLL